MMNGIHSDEESRGPFRSSVLRPAILILAFGLLSVGPVYTGPSPESQESSFRGRLIDAVGESLAVRIDLKGRSSEDDMLRLYWHWSLGDIEGFMGAFRGMRCGSLRFIGGSGASVPLCAAIATPSGDGERILVVGEGRRDLLPGTRKRVARKYLFLALVLDMNAEGRGEGLIYEDADVDFERESIVVRSSVSTPKRLINILRTSGARLAVPDPALRRSKDLIDRALSCLDFMLYEEAVSLFEQVLERNADRPDARYHLAYAYFRLGKRLKSLEILGHETTLHPGDIKALALESFLKFQAGQTDDAERSALGFLAALEKIKTTERRAAAAILMVAPKTSLPAGPALRALFPNAGIPSYILGLIASERGDIASARARFAEAEDLGYSPHACRAKTIDAEIQTKNWEEALRLCLMPIGPSSEAEIFLRKGYIYDRIGKHEESLTALKTAAAMKPFDACILKSIAIAHMNRGDRTKALPFMVRAADLAPEDPEIQVWIDGLRAPDLLEARAGKDATSIPLPDGFLKAKELHYQHVFKGNPADVANRTNGTALQLIREGRVSDAHGLLEAFIEIYEDSPTIFFNLGLLANSLERPAQALECAMRAIRLKGDYRDAYDLAANVCFKTGDFALSTALYEEALRLDPGDPLSLYNLGLAYRALGDEIQAKARLQEAVSLEKAPIAGPRTTETDINELKRMVHIKVEPISAPACFSIGQICLKQGKPDEALDWFRKAIDFNPGDPSPYYEIGKLYFERGEKDRAKEYFHRFLSLGGDEAKLRAIRKQLQPFL